jgi:hypothetical protein
MNKIRGYISKWLQNKTPHVEAGVWNG